MQKTELEKYKAFEKEFYTTRDEWIGIDSLISAFTPTNLLQEKDLFHNKKRVPQFKYKLPHTRHLKDKLAYISQQEFPKGPLEEDYNRSNEAQILRLEHLLGNENSDSGLKVSRYSWGHVEKETVEKAHEMLQPPDDKVENKALSVKQANKQIQSSLDTLGYKGWKLVPHSNPGYSIKRISKEIKFPDWGRMFSQIEISRLIAHEIETHVLRAENGRLQPLKIFLQGFHKQIVTEEGLAVFSEAQNNLLSSYDLKKYAYRAIAAKAASDKHADFIQVYNLLEELGVDKDLAWNTTYRAFRGGRMIKDHIYLQGYLKVQKLRPEEIKELYYGKVGIDQLAMIPKYKQAGFIMEDPKLPNHLQ